MIYYIILYYSKSIANEFNLKRKISYFIKTKCHLEN